MFRDTLHRPIDPNTQSQIQLALALGFSRQQIAGSVLNSDEFHGHLVNFPGPQDNPFEDLAVHGFYQAFLRRNADPQGFDTFTGLLRQGVRDEVVIASIIGSPEYFVRV